ncbi:PAS domain-containing protein [Tessaracoccus sp. HDW20]|nr:PAS domain-containing protein [Tessaracoccus coleopterorum]NHB86116.1 PAS domain-containing protein [Tessaracoccus coleopterorum]
MDPAELQGTPLPDLIHPDDRSCVLATAHESMGAFGRVCHTEARVRDAQGGHRWMSITMKIAVDAGGEPVARICTWRDIETEVAVRGELRDETASREAITDSTIDAVVSVSAGARSSSGTMRRQGCSATRRARRWVVPSSSWCRSDSLTWRYAGWVRPAPKRCARARATSTASGSTGATGRIFRRTSPSRCGSAGACSTSADWCAT